MSDMKDTFSSCAKCARDGLGGAVISHLGCVAVPLVAGAAGAGISGTFMMAAMFIASPLIAAGASYGLDRLRGVKPTAVKMAGSAAFALVLSFGIHSVFGHDHAGHDHHGHHHDAAMAAPGASGHAVTPDMAANAAALGMSLPDYGATICTGGRNDLKTIP